MFPLICGTISEDISNLLNYGGLCKNVCNENDGVMCILKDDENVQNKGNYNNQGSYSFSKRENSQAHQRTLLLSSWFNVESLIGLYGIEYE